MQVVGLEPLADAKGFGHRPALVDVAHQAHLRSDHFADTADAIDFLLRFGAAGQRQLGLHCRPAALHQPAGVRHHGVERLGAHQRAAGISGYAVPIAAEKAGERQAKRLAADIPKGRVDGRLGKREEATWARRAGGLPQLVGYVLHVVRIAAHGERAQLIYGNLQRSCHCSAEEGDAHALDPICGEDLGNHDVARGARHRLAVRQGLVGRQTHDLGCNPFDLHGNSPWSLRKGVAQPSQSFPRLASEAGLPIPVEGSGSYWPRLSGPTLWPNSLAQLSGPTLWPNSLAQLSGPALWPSSLAQLFGPVLWPSPLAQASGPNLRPKPLAKTSGQNLWPNLWPKPLAKTSGQNLWPKPLDSRSQRLAGAVARR